MNAVPPEILAKLRTLIVEPVKSFAVDLEDALESLGIAHITVTTTEAEAVELAKTHKPDLVFCSINLSGHGDGFDTANRIFETHASAVIFISTCHDPDGARYALRNSPFTCVFPPFKSQQLGEAVADALYKFRKGIASPEALGELAVTDPFTSLGTRHKLDITLYHEWNRCALEETPLTLFLINLENLGGFENDGRREALKKISAALRIHCARRRDVVAGDGTTRLMALLPDTDEPGARHVAGQIIDAVRDLHLSPPNSPDVTAAVGIGVTTPSWDKATSSLVTWTELQLDTAERRGGNRFHGGAMQTAAAESKKGLLARWLSFWAPRPEDKRESR